MLWTKQKTKTIAFFSPLSLTHSHTHTLQACTHSCTQAQTLTPTDIHTHGHTHNAHTMYTCIHSCTFSHIQFRLIKWHCLAMFAGISCPLLFDELLHLALLFQSLELFCKLQLVNISWEKKKKKVSFQLSLDNKKSKTYNHIKNKKIWFFSSFHPPVTLISGQTDQSHQN